MISRSPSYHSLSADVFHSAPSSRPMTPRIPAGLSMTPSHHHLPTFDSEPHSRDSTNTSASSVRRVPSLADLQRRLLETQRAIESSESDDETETPALGSAFSSRAPSRDASRATSREPSPKRKSNWVVSIRSHASSDWMLTEGVAVAIPQFEPVLRIPSDRADGRGSPSTASPPTAEARSGPDPDVPRAPPLPVVPPGDAREARRAHRIRHTLHGRPLRPVQSRRHATDTVDVVERDDE